MYLSQVDIFGFKSFAKKTSITFDDGITAIVGPNGCGKTNVVDAIRWVLGEQKASILRSEKMENVIFNGAATKKPLGMAEVALVIQNTKNVLPSEYTEVEITRRLYRSGESEYLLNKQVCRLKDIINLFADTGMGSDAYSVIELKMVETILSDRAEDRRHMFDEAAGITKYKKRREAALRRMEETEHDLERINDIVVEADRSVKNLRRQAKKSERYQNVLERSKELERDISRWSLSHVMHRLEPLSVALQAARRDLAQYEGELTRDEAVLEQFLAESISMDKTLGSAVENYNKVTDALNEANQRKMTNDHKQETLRERLRQLTLEAESLTSKIQEGENLLAEGRSKLERMDTQQKQAQQDLETAQTELLDFYQEYNRQKNRVEGVQEGLLQIIQQHSLAMRTHEAHKKEFDDWQRRVTRQKDESADLERSLSDKRVQAEHITTRLGDLHRRQETTTQELRALREVYTQGRQTIDESREALVHLRSAQESRRQRLEFLTNFIQSGSGATGGGQSLLARRGALPGLRGAVGELIRVDAPFRKAVEAALGEALGWLVFDTRAQAYEAVEWLEQHKGGRATLVPLESLGSAPRPAPGDAPGRPVSDLVACDAAIRPVIDFLLQDIRFVDSVQAVAVTQQRLVDGHGRLAAPAGMLSGGEAPEEAPSYLSVTAEIDRLSAELQEGEQTHASRQQLLQEQYTLSEQHQQRIKELEHDSDELNRQIHTLDTERRVTEFDIRKDEEQLARLYKEGEQLGFFRIDTDRLEEEAREIRRLNDERESLQENLDALKAASEGLEQRRQTLEQTKHQQHLRLHEIENDYKNTAQELNRLTGLLEEYQERIVHGADEQAEKRAMLAECESSAGQFSAVTQELLGKRASIQTELDTLKNSQAMHREKVSSLERTCRHKRDDVNKRREDIHHLDLELENLKRDRRDLEEKIGPAGLADLPAWDPGAYNLEDAKNELQNLQESLAGYGQINFMALEQFREEEERLEHLTRQREDIIQAKATLQETITKINTRAREEFLQTFTAIQEYFVTIYNKFFGAGSASLRLEEDVDPLEAKVLIFAQPSGKRFQSIALLSAGEKALTAIALLMAIYKVKPSPFCILDEVDAPLDDANVDRFLKVLREFSVDTQFIIVTHNKRTMASAKFIYGVTQQEDGVSKVVSVDMK